MVNCERRPIAVGNSSRRRPSVCADAAPRRAVGPIMEPNMTDHPVATHDEWLAARRQLLAEEKDFTRLRDELSAKRRAMPWLRIDKHTWFDGPEGGTVARRPVRRTAPADRLSFHVRARLGEALQELLVLGRRLQRRDPASRPARHAARCGVARAAGKARGYREADGLDISLVLVRRRRFQLRLPRLFHPEQVADGTIRYNFASTQTKMTDLPGISAFIKEPDGAIFRTYSGYARGLDMLNPAYQLLDITALGRHEDDLPFPMAWVKLHDEYAA